MYLEFKIVKSYDSLINIYKKELHVNSILVKKGILKADPLKSEIRTRYLFTKSIWELIDS